MSNINSKILLLNSLNRQYLIEPLSRGEDIISKSLGIQAQYINNAIFSINVRTQPKFLKHSDFEKCWSFRGTLHIHNRRDVYFFRSFLSQFWFDRWGKYLKRIITDEDRVDICNKTIQFLENGKKDKTKIRECFILHGYYNENVIDTLFSSWGGILKDLNYNNKIIYSDLTSGNFKLYTIINSESMNYIDDLIYRYIAFYGPATINDLCYFLGAPICIIKPFFDKLTSNFSCFSLNNKKYFYINSLLHNSTDLPECLFISGYDPLIMGYKNKSRIFEDDLKEKIILNNGFIKNIVLLFGEVVATWKVHNNKLTISFLKNTNDFSKKIISKFAWSLDYIKFKQIDYI